MNKEEIIELAWRAIEEAQQSNPKLEEIAIDVATYFFFKGFMSGWNKCAEDTDNFILRSLKDIHNL